MIARFERGELGQSMVEFALTLPLLVFTLIGGAELARAYAVQLAVQNGARAGAEGAALDATPTQAEATAWTQQEMSRTPGMDPSNATITVTFTQRDFGSPCTNAGSIAVAGPSSIAVPCYANVRVRYTYHTLIAWPGLPNTFRFDRSTHVRRYQ